MSRSLMILVCIINFLIVNADDSKFACPSGWFQCANQHCVLNRWKCDGTDDCGDASDEGPFCHIVPAQCNSNEYRCHDSSKCVDLNWVCDGHVDCIDGSDEVTGCHEQKHCDGYACKINGECLAKHWHCDGIIDCPDESDELNCSASENNFCTEHNLKFYCEDRSFCLPRQLVCNGIKNCRDGSDEGGQCEEKTCEKTGCSHGCFQMPHKAHCYCPAGYELGTDGIHCEDVDECINQSCSHYCHNTIGSFVCSCHEGYDLQPSNGHFCAVQKPEPMLLYAASTEIKELKIRSGQMFSVKSGLNHAIGIDYDSHENKIYWSEIAKGVERIRTCTLNGEDDSVVVDIGIRVVEDVAIDWIVHNVYFTDSGLMRLGVCSKDGIHCKVLFEKLLQPRALIVEPTIGIMYWSDWSHTPKIEKSGMDGSSRSDVVSTDLGWPNGLAVDHILKRLYWIDAKLNRVEYVTLDGRNERHIVVEQMMLHPFAFAMFEDTFYWTDWSRQTLESCNKFTGSNHQVLVKEEHDKIPMGVHIYHPILQITATNPCLGHGCGHLCLIAPNNGHKCECSLGYTLQGDGVSCMGSQSTRTFVAIEHEIHEFVKAELGRNEFREVMKTQGHSAIGAFAFNPANNSLLYSDLGIKQLVTYDFKTSQHTTFVSSHIEAVNCIAIDWTNGNVYWADAGRKTLEVSNMNGKHRKLLISENLDYPMSIALVPQKGIMFLSFSSGHRPRIEQMAMDGSNRHILLDFHDDAPLSLSVDVERELLYWTNENSGIIEWSHFDGKQRHTLDQYSGRPGDISAAPNIVSWMDVAEGLHLWVYNESANLLEIFELQLDSDARSTVLSRLLVTQSSYKNVGQGVCRNGGCSHLCLPNEKSYSCACSSGLKLGKDGRTCEIEIECSKYEFKCSDNKCIHFSYTCDDIKDCPNGEDEQNCKPECTPGQHKCPDGQCIPSSWLCDRMAQCSDGSDEFDCIYDSCPDNWFQCIDDGKCIVNDWLCDAHNDCKDRSDEKNCTQKPSCKSDEFSCHSGHCIPSGWRCDGEIDCRDASDEDTTCQGTPIKKCEIMEFTCANGHCVTTDLVCDHDDDCGDGSDESSEHCVEHRLLCPMGMYKCSQTNRCILFKSLCDGINDCLDDEDERGCGNDNKCNQENEFGCLDNGHCIPRDWTCDGDGDCGDASDEHLEECHSGTVAPPKSPVPLFTDLKARTGHSHHQVFANGSVSAELIECDLMEYECHSGECIQLHDLCNHFNNCRDGSDEGIFCGPTCEVDNGGCSDLCVPMELGPDCRCREGYHLGDDTKTCYEIDECMYVGACSQNCKNVPGSFVCSCVDGYELKSDGRSCKARGDPAKFLIAYPSKIVSTSLGSGRESLVTHSAHGNITDIDFDARTSTVYWVDSAKGTLSRYNTKSKFQVVLLMGLRSPAALVVDWISRQLVYWEGQGSGHVTVCDLDGNHCVDGVNIGPKTVGSMAIDARYGLLFWTTWSSTEYSAHGTVERAYLNGKQRNVLASDKLVWPAGLTIDYLHHELYWVDAHLEIIETMSIHGEGRRIVTREVNRPFALTVFEDHLYWADWKTNSIRSCNKFYCDEIDILYNNTVKVCDLAVSHNVQQLRGLTSCMSGDVFSGLSKKCSHICMSAANSFTCYCPHGMILDNETGRNCAKEKPPQPKSCKSAKFCFNGGSCHVNASGAELCACLAGFSGARCEEKLLDTHESVSYKDGSNHGLVTGLIIGIVFIIVAAAAAYFYYRRFGFSFDADKFRNQFAAVRLRNPKFGPNGEPIDDDTDIDEVCYGTDSYKSYSNPLYNDKVAIDATSAMKKGSVSFHAVESSASDSESSSTLLEYSDKADES